ncbi:transglutaminase domain-containing protein [Foetidibacter luteolus]|uniref:transglutaminase domain-containing protein n=1 Tax=Foetidibacter luteolus TaxID=2608880 RepID=UPI00129A43D3|nr:transglutaminase domain-containing protein [Foetidibacter luteolus]
MLLRIACLAGLLLFPLTCLKAQPPAEWWQVEQFVRMQPPIQNSKDLKLLTLAVNHRFADTLSRLKAVYVWLTANMAYDEKDSRGKNINIDSALKYKTAICAGYTNLFEQLCEGIGVKAIEIPGYGSSTVHAIPQSEKFTVNHAWNAVWLGGRWQLIDATWASGYTQEGEQTFIKRRNDWYFLTDPEKMIRDHYPKQSAWQLLKDTLSWEAFKLLPVFSLGAQEDSITAYGPSGDTIYAKQGDVIHFWFNTRKRLNKIIFKSKEKNISVVADLTSTTSGYSYDFKVPHTGIYDLSIILTDFTLQTVQPGKQYGFLIDFMYRLNIKR